MRAMIYRAYGGPERLELVDIPRPSPGPGQVLVRVIASSVNPVDWKLASGRLRLFMPVKLPLVPGFDVAGDIAELGRCVTGYAIGDRVHARIATNGGTGACAEFAVVGLDVLANAVTGMDAGEAAGLPLAGVTALQGLRDQAGLPLEGASGRVLVVGASGGVGHIAVQISRAAGATVVGVCSERNLELVSSLGAHEVIDYNSPNPYGGQAPFDIVFDCVDPVPAMQLAAQMKGDKVAAVLWVKPARFAGLAQPLPAGRMYVSSTLLDGEAVAPLSSAPGPVFMAHPFLLPGKSDPAMLRFRLWAQTRDIELSEPRMQAEAFFACLALNDAVKHVGRFFVRDYALDMLDHAQSLTAYIPFHPRPTFGPHQRFVNKGGYILPVVDGKPDTTNAVWVRP